MKGHGKKGSSANHILFADDVIFFSKAMLNMSITLKRFLNCLLGLHIKVIFSKGVVRMIRSKSSFKEGVLPFKYLGVPLHSTKLNNVHF